MTASEPLLSTTLARYTDEHLAARASELAPVMPHIEAELAALEADEALLVRFFCATLPLSDVFDTEPALLASFARHALMLRREMPWCAALDEPTFVHFVTYPRINTEPVTDCRPVFWRELAERVQGKSAADAVIETNYWCAEHATYQASDGRTLGPLGVLASGDGRCGEESTFLVTALRSIGIPARQLYVPWWAHCDDNHAWVEAQVDGSWHYLGACEPEEALDRGWFTAASGRAMAVQTRTYADFGFNFERDRARLTREGDMVIVNVTSSYAPVITLTVEVADATGAPAAGVDVDLSIMNAGGWRDIARLVTDEDGRAAIEVGAGSLRVYARTATGEADTIIDTAAVHEVHLQLAAYDAAFPATAWRALDLDAPADHPAPSMSLTPEQQAAGRVRKAEADRMRVERLQGLAAAAHEAAERVATRYAEAGCSVELPDGRTLAGIFSLSFANAPELEAFLTEDIARDRLELASTLSDKDFRDLCAAVLEDHLQHARALRDAVERSLLAQDLDAAEASDLFRRYVLSPRTDIEQLTPYRTGLLDLLDEDQRRSFAEDPASIWTFIRENVTFDPARQLMHLAASPVGALVSHQGNPSTQRGLFVAIARTLGIPARLNPVDRAPEFFAEGAFRRAEAVDTTPRAHLVLTCPEGMSPIYEQDWGLAAAVCAVAPSGATCREHQMLDLWGSAFADGKLVVDVTPGRYRLTTAVRLPNGNQLASELDFDIADAAAERMVALEFREPKAADMLCDIPLDDFPLEDAAGEPTTAHTAATAHGASFALVALLEPAEEPTEHLLNELRQHADRVAEAGLALVCAVSDADIARRDPTLSHTLEALPAAQLMTCDFDAYAERLARRMFVNPEKLPLAILVDVRTGRLIGRYASAGYNVGTVDLVLKLVRLAAA